MNIRFHRGPRRGLQFRASVWMALALGAGLAAAQPMSLGVMRDFSVPDFHDPPHETQLRWLFKGAEARPQTGGLIWVREITLQQFQTNGQRELLIESPECIFNSGTREASSSQALRMQLQDGRLTLAGEGFYWQATNSLLVISNQVQTTVRGGWLAATAEGVPAVSPLAGDARVEAEEFIYNHSALLATYHRNVRATSTNFHLTSEQLTFNVPAEAGGTVEALVAEQNVALELGAWQACGARAVYTPSNGWLHLTGAVTWRAETREGSGDTVLLDGAAQRLDVQGNARLRLPVTGAGLVPQQAPAAASGDETNRFVTIMAMRYELQTNHARFEGGVNVTERAGEQVRGRLTCGTLQIALGGTNQVQDLVAEREVVIEQETRRLTGQRMDYNAATGEARLTGQPTWQDGERHGAGEVLLAHLADNRFIVRGGAQLTLPGADDNQLLGALVPRPESTRVNPTPTSSAPAKSVQITSETYELSPKGAVFQGDVRVDDAQMQLTCERLTVTIAPDGTNVANIVADGNVVMNLTEASGAASTATCARAVYTAATEQLEFSGQPVVDRADGSRFAAEKIVMDRTTGKLSALGQLHFQGRWSPPGNESQAPPAAVGKTERAASPFPGHPVKKSPVQLSPAPAASEAAATPLLVTERLVKEYRQRRVVNGVSLTVAAGEIVGLLGPNGAGKTTTFNMVVGLVRPDEGQVRFQGRDLTRLAMHQRARRGMGYLTQEPSVFRKLTVEQNIRAILETCAVGRAERRVRLKYLLDELDLTPLARSKAYQLSGGEKRRLEITRALVTSPKLLLLDEPFSGIDPIAVYEVQKIIRRLKERGLGILVTDHNVRETLKLVDRAYLIHKGEVVYEGDAARMVEDPKAREIYLGPDFNM